jgi:septal ring factor EnvC (AmiA/AmiB activator)
MKICLIFVLSFLYIQPLSGQDTDSLILEDVQTIKKSLWVLQNKLEKNQENEYKDIEALKKMNDSLLNELEAQNANLENTQQAVNENTQKHAKNIQVQLDSINKENSTRSIIHFILHGAAIILILYLLWFLIKERKNNIDHLIKKTEKLDVQNDDILEKADELSKIKDKLKKIHKQQKKIKKKKK